jgi:hypothetical protein
MAAKRLGYDFTLEEDAARVEVRRRRPSLRGQFADLALRVLRMLGRAV